MIHDSPFLVGVGRLLCYLFIFLPHQSHSKGEHIVYQPASEAPELTGVVGKRSSAWSGQRRSTCQGRALLQCSKGSVFDRHASICALSKVCLGTNIRY